MMHYWIEKQFRAQIGLPKIGNDNMNNNMLLFLIILILNCIYIYFINFI